MIRELSAYILGFGLSILFFLFTSYVSREYHRREPVVDKSIWLLVLVPIFYVASRYLPNFYSLTHNMTFVQHMVGGGFVSALLYLYFKKALGLKLTPLLDLLALYMVVSSLGVANELLEFAINQTGRYKLDGGDVWWDLTANTLGALLCYALYHLIKSIFGRSKKV